MITKNEVGNRYTRLIVLEQASSIGKCAAWKCQCDCGNIAIAKGIDLRRKDTKSCGCYRKEMAGNNLRNYNLKSSGHAACTAVLGNYKRRAKKKGVAWGLSRGAFISITQLDCHYCGVEPRQVWQRKDYNGKFIYNGIDRLDSSKGYTIGNIVPSCFICNRAKFDLSAKEFLDWVNRISEHQGKL